MREFRTVKAWQLAHQLALDVYALSDKFPRSESFGLVMQLRRSAVSPPQRIAEACGQPVRANAVRALGLARATQVELEYLLLLSRDLGLLEENGFVRIQEQLVSARKALSGYLRAVESEL